MAVKASPMETPKKTAAARNWARVRENPNAAMDAPTKRRPTTPCSQRLATASLRRPRV